MFSFSSLPNSQLNRRIAARTPWMPAYWATRAFSLGVKKRYEPRFFFVHQRLTWLLCWLQQGCLEQSFLIEGLWSRGRHHLVESSDKEPCHLSIVVNTYALRQSIASYYTCCWPRPPISCSASAMVRARTVINIRGWKILWLLSQPRKSWKLAPHENCPPYGILCVWLQIRGGHPCVHLSVQ